LYHEASALVVMEAAAQRTQQELQFAQTKYTGDNFDEARQALSVARVYSEAASQRLKKEVADEMLHFAALLDHDEVAMVWEQLLTKFEFQQDTQVCAEIQGFVAASVYAAATMLTELLDVGAETVGSKDALDEVKDALDEVARNLMGAVTTATKMAARLIHTPVTDSLWLDAKALSGECSHLRLCVEARQSADVWLASIKRYQSRDIKTLPMRASAEAKRRYQAAHDSAPPRGCGYSRLYTLPESSGVRLSSVCHLLKLCDNETEKCMQDTEDQMIKSRQKLLEATHLVLDGHVTECQRLLAEVVDLDMVMTPEFWQRCRMVQEVARSSARLGQLELLATQQHAHALDLAQDQVCQYTHVGTHTCTNTCTHTCTNTCTHTCTNTCTHTCTNTCTHTCTHPGG
jgi:hypothetical protein